MGNKKIMMSTTLCDVTLCGLVEFTDILEEWTASIFMVKDQVE